jgi:DNA-binding winged helix-turn-helix (wHTH) protein
LLKVSPGRFRFERFSLDPSDRLLLEGDAPVALNARYLDALALLVREHGKLVTKDRFLDEVWRGVPVTDEALTQCIRTLRRQLGDGAASPRFIETVPKHGYRFVAEVEWVESRSAIEVVPRRDWRGFLLQGTAGTLGGGAAGLLGGLFYGLVGASEPLQPGGGALSILLVMVAVTVVLALVGGAGVAFGVAAARFATSNRGPLTILGGAAGGLVVGAAVKLLGLDAFNLLVGQSPGDITGAPEGAVLGAGVGLGAWLASRLSLRRAIVAGGATGAAAGLLITLLGGRIMGGSLDLLSRRFPGSRLHLDQIGALFGEPGFGPISLAATAALEGLLFGAGVVGAMRLAKARE